MIGGDDLQQLTQPPAALPNEFIIDSSPTPGRRYSPQDEIRGCAGEIEDMARSYIAVSTGQPIDNIAVRIVTSRWWKRAKKQT